jgi:hypothetical protein
VVPIMSMDQVVNVQVITAGSRRLTLTHAGYHE